MISLGQADEGDYYKLDYRQARRESWGGSGSMTACFFVKIMLRDLNLLFSFTLLGSFYTTSPMPRDLK